MELKYTEAHHSYVFLSEAFTLANAANTKMVSAFVIMDPYAWALKSKYYAGQHPTSRFFFLLFFFFLSVESALYSQEQILKESTS